MKPEQFKPHSGKYKIFYKMSVWMPITEILIDAKNEKQAITKWSKDFAATHAAYITKVELISEVSGKYKPDKATRVHANEPKVKHKFLVNIYEVDNYNGNIFHDQKEFKTEKQARVFVEKFNKKHLAEDSYLLSIYAEDDPSFA